MSVSLTPSLVQPFGMTAHAAQHTSMMLRGLPRRIRKLGIIGDSRQTQHYDSFSSPGGNFVVAADGTFTYGTASSSGYGNGYTEVGCYLNVSRAADGHLWVCRVSSIVDADRVAGTILYANPTALVAGTYTPAACYRWRSSGHMPHLATGYQAWALALAGQPADAVFSTAYAGGRPNVAGGQVQIDAVIAEGCDEVWSWMGVNNLLDGTDAATTITYLDAFYDQLRAAGIRVRAIGENPHASYSVATYAGIKEVNEWLIDRAASDPEYFDYIDTVGLFRANPSTGVSISGTPWIDATVHPGPLAHRLLGEVLASRLTVDNYVGRKPLARTSLEKSSPSVGDLAVQNGCMSVTGLTAYPYTGVPTNWAAAVVGAGSVTKTEQVVRATSGEPAYRLTMTSAANSTNVYAQTPTVSCTPGEKYRLRGRLRLSNLASVDYVQFAVLNNTSGSVFGHCLKDAAGAFPDGRDVVLDLQGEGPVVGAGAQDLRVRVRVYFTATAGGAGSCTVQLEDVELERIE